MTKRVIRPWLMLAMLGVSAASATTLAAVPAYDLVIRGGTL